MNNYIEKLKEHSWAFGAEIDAICQRSGGTASKFFPFLNFVAMSIIEGKTHKHYEDHEECKRMSMEFLKEHIKCLIKGDPFGAGFDTYAITYEKDDGETLPFSRITMKSIHSSVDAYYNGLSARASSCAPDTLDEAIHNGYAYDEYAYKLMHSIITTSTYQVRGMIDGYGKYINMLPTPKELGRAIKETPPLSTFSTTPITRAALRHKLLYGNISDGEYVYAGVWRHGNGTELERSTEYFAKKSGTLLRIYSAQDYLNITREDKPRPFMFREFFGMEDIQGADIARTVLDYAKETNKLQALLQDMNWQYSHLSKLLNPTDKDTTQI